MDVRKQKIAPPREPHVQQKEIEAPHQEMLESPHDMLLEEHTDEHHDQHPGFALMRWQAPEFVHSEKSDLWYLVMAIIIGGISLYAVLSNNPIMAITFIMLGIAGYLMLQKKPRVIDFIITHEGIITDREILDFENIHSFWIFYDPPYEKILSLRMKGGATPYAHIPIEDQDPSEIRRILLGIIPEKKQQKNMLNVMKNLLQV